MNSLHKTFFAISIFLLCPAVAFAQSGEFSKGRIKQLIEAGALNPLSGEDVSDTVGSSIVVADDKNGEKVIEGKRNRWTDENVDKIADSLETYMQRYDIQIDKNKEALILEHLQKYAAFKTAIFSSMPPSDELSQIIAGQIARGIRWANRSDVRYPNETQRQKAKDQIQQTLIEAADALQTLTVDLGLDETIQKETAILVAGYEWRTDSPFFSIGKKVFSEKELRTLIDECLKLCAENTDLQQLTPPADLTPGQLQLFERGREMNVRMLLHSVTAPLARDYIESAQKAPSKEEQQESRELLKRIKQNLKQEKKP